MIHIEPKQLTPVEQKEIYDWLNLPAARKFQRYVAQLAAMAVAQLGNLMVEELDPDEVSEANYKLAVEAAKIKANSYLTCNSVLDEIHDSGYEWPTAELKPVPRDETHTNAT